jgi:hypothetical protein
MEFSIGANGGVDRLNIYQNSDRVIGMQLSTEAAA